MHFSMGPASFLRLDTGHECRIHGVHQVHIIVVLGAGFLRLLILTAHRPQMTLQPSQLSMVSLGSNE